MKKVWMRLGVLVEITDDEEKTIFGGDADGQDIGQLIRTAVAEGRFAPHGDSYIPATCVEDLNYVYGTNYKVDDIDFDC